MSLPLPVHIIETLILPQLEKEGWIGLHPLIKDNRLISLGFFFCIAGILFQTP